MKYLVIQPDGSYAFHESKKKEPSLETLQELVGGYIERVVVKYKGLKYNAYINEEGKMNRLPLNLRATALYHANWSTGVGYDDLDVDPQFSVMPNWDPIVGVMVITGIRD